MKVAEGEPVLPNVYNESVVLLLHQPHLLFFLVPLIIHDYVYKYLWKHLAVEHVVRVLVRCVFFAELVGEPQQIRNIFGNL